MASARLHGIDTVRGVGMILVCFSHFVSAASQTWAGGLQATLPIWIGMIASPTFIIVSGLILGFLHERSRQSPERLRLQFIDRALLLLFVVHLLLMGARLLGGESLERTLGWLPITDVIAAAILMNLWLVPRLSRTARLALAAVVFGGSWVLWQGWHPETAWLLLLKEALTGTASATPMVIGFALLPWIALHLAATTLGEPLAWYSADPGKRVAYFRRLLWLGGGAVVTAVAGKLAFWWWKAEAGAAAAGEVGSALYLLSSPLQKFPPSPAYVLFYGGIGLTLISLVLIAEQHGRFAFAFGRLAVLGRASLVVWVVQAYLYDAGVRVLRLPYTPLWPLYFVASVAIIWMLAVAWDRRGWNRHLTLGLMKRLDNPQPVAARPAPPCLAPVRVALPVSRRQVTDVPIACIL